VPFGGGILAEYYCGGMIFDHPDQLGSATSATDCTGNIVNVKLFLPFGEFWTGAANPNLGMHQTFAQLPDYDAETDQYNTAARHYTPSGRWLSPDPDNAGADPSDPQTWNMYAYAGNNPTSLVDPSGLGPADCQSDAKSCMNRNPFSNGNGGCQVDGVQTFCEETALLLGSGSAVFCPNDNCNGLMATMGTGGSTVWQQWTPVYQNTVSINGKDYKGPVRGEWAALGGVAAAGSELGPGDIALIAGTSALILLSKNKDAIKQIMAQVVHAAKHIGYLGDPNQNPNDRNGWRREIRAAVKKGRLWANRMSPGLRQDMMNALLDQVEWAVPKD
jgi:RHS repeat-associated protein